MTTATIFAESIDPAQSLIPGIAATPRSAPKQGIENLLGKTLFVLSALPVLPGALLLIGAAVGVERLAKWIRSES